MMTDNETFLAVTGIICLTIILIQFIQSVMRGGDGQ